jgi:virulence-associated protein VagC
MAIAKVFRSGNSQVVQLPEELQFALDTEEVEAHRVGDRIVLELVQSAEWPESFWRAFGGVTADFARPWPAVQATDTDTTPEACPSAFGRMMISTSRPRRVRKRSSRSEENRLSL